MIYLARNHHLCKILARQTSRGAQSKRSSDALCDDFLEGFASEGLDGVTEDGESVVGICRRVACRPNVFVDDNSLEKVCATSSMNGGEFELGNTDHPWKDKYLPAASHR
jgi:hypothetical protein